VAVVAASLVLVAACGKSNSALPSATKVYAAASIGKERFAKYADAVNLQALDALPLVGAPRPRETRSGPSGPSVEKCDGAATGAEGVVGLRSQTFHLTKPAGNTSTLTLLPLESVHSTVYLMASEARASQALEAAVGARARACVTRFVLQSGTSQKENGVKEPIFNHVSVSALRRGLPGLQVYGLQVMASSAFEAPGTTGRSKYIERLLGFVVGPTVVTLEDVGDPRAFPSTAEQRLLALLYARSIRHQL
jgi:hypothetical protein